MKATLGRIVLFVISQTDANLINTNRQKANPKSGTVSAEQVFPAIVVKEFETGAASLKVFLDGDDTHWVQCRSESQQKLAGTWHWPPRIDASAPATPAASPAPPPSVGDWDAEVAVFRTADGSVIQPETDAERVRRGLSPIGGAPVKFTPPNAGTKYEVHVDAAAPDAPAESDRSQDVLVETPTSANPDPVAEQSPVEASADAPQAPGPDNALDAANPAPEQ